MTHQRTSSLLSLTLFFLVAGVPPIASGNEVPADVIEAEQSRIAAIAKATRPSISVFGAGDAQGGGSGVVISSDGYALTNYHVVKPCGNHMRCSMPDGELYDAVLVSIDPTGDVALIKLLGREDFPHAEIGDSDSLRVGDWCFAIGNPFLLATDFQPTVTYGIVSGVHRYQYPAGTLLEYTDCIQTDASINPGNSGGPLFDADGKLVGVNGRGSFEKRGRVNVGVGYAISINQIKNFMGYLHSGRIVDHATLGATVGQDEDGRVLVTNILTSSDAYRRGLRYGDELISFAAREIGTVNAFKNVLGIYPRGWRVPLSYRRDGTRRDIFVRLAGVHRREELINKVQAAPRPRLIPGQPKPGEPKPGEPKPGEKDDTPKDAPKEGEEGGPKRPNLPFPLPRIKPKVEMPEHIKKQFAKKRGYANYHFNQLNRQRVWSAFVSATGGAAPKGKWVLDGELDQQGSVQLTYESDELFARFLDSEQAIDLSANLDAQPEPKGSGGLFVALHLWKRMLQKGPTQFGDVFYLGTAPLPGISEPADVLVGTYEVVEVWFYFDSATGRMIAMELFPESDMDPCEIRFDEYKEVEGYHWPLTAKIIFGDTQFGTIEWKSITASPGEPEVAPAGAEVNETAATKEIAP